MDAKSEEERRIEVEIDDEIAIVRINRPDKLNALTETMLVSLASTIAQLGRRGESRGVVLAGAGRAFSAGEDLSELGRVRGHEAVAAAVDNFHDITRAILQTEVPVVAALEGLAVGGAAELTLACDARIGSTTAEFFLPENSRGIIVSNAASHLLPRLVGRTNAIDLVLESRRIDARHAASIGLLDSVVGVGEATNVAVETVRRWSSKVTSHLHLQLLRPPLSSLEAAMTAETRAAVTAWELGATDAGVAEFLESR